MNNKGYTLIEIIAVIGLLSLIGVMIGTNLVSMNQKQNAKNYETYKQKIADAACIFLESRDFKSYSNSTAAIMSVSNETGAASSLRNREQCVTPGASCFVPVKLLVQFGYIDEKMKDPTTQEPVKEDEIACIKYVQGEKRCYYITGSQCIEE